MNIKDNFYTYLKELQEKICHSLEQEDGKETFISDPWTRPEGGGGITRVISNGQVFEKGGVNISAVEGRLPETMQKAFGVEDSDFFACGLSLVIHPVNPYVPTVHANWRYFERYDSSGTTVDAWFGGGADLTPYYIFEEDGNHFHRTIKEAMDPFDGSWYFTHKEHCDRYFTNTHRGGEARGIGGVFYDYLRPQSAEESMRLLEFQKANGDAFINAYLPIVQRRKNIPYEEREINWQEIRRGRYVEFNLIHDRGTLFGLKTNGRIESILMSLPPRARWIYDYHPEPGSPEAKLLEFLKPRDWINISNHDD